MDERKEPINSEEEEQKELAKLFPMEKIKRIKKNFAEVIHQSLKIHIDKDSKFHFIESNQGELYLIDPNPIGEGSFGSVSKAWKIVDHSNLIDKKLLPQNHPIVEFAPLAIKFFKTLVSETEIKAITILSDPEATESKLGLSKQIIMRYIPGQQLIDDKGHLHESIKTLSLENRMDIIVAILKKLKQIHALGWAHCDIKGANIKFEIDPVTQKINVFIVDFGSSRKLENLTIDKSALGTEKYLSPERKLGLIRPSTDIFAIAKDIPLILGDIDLPKQIPEETRQKILLIKDNFIAKMTAHFPQDRPSDEEALKFFKDFQTISTTAPSHYPAFFLSSKNENNFLNEFLQNYEKLAESPAPHQPVKK